jgi:hypothetical protein
LTDTEPLLPVPPALPPFPELITLLPTTDTDTVDVAVFAAGEIGAKYVSDSLKGGITMLGSVISEKSVTNFIQFVRRHEQIQTTHTSFITNHCTHSFLSYMFQLHVVAIIREPRNCMEYSKTSMHRFLGEWKTKTIYRGKQ